MVSLVDLLSAHYAPIQQCMFSYLGVPEVLALTKACRALACVQQRFKETSYDVNLCLQPFFTHPHEFRSLQAQCDALIVGDFARRFFTRRTSELLEMKIVIEVKHVHILTTYLSRADFAIESTNEDLLKGQVYVKHCTDGKKRRFKVQYTDTSTIIETLVSAGTTACQNFITWNKAYALFPYTTFMRQEAYLIELSERMDLEYAAMTEQEGIRIKSSSWMEINPMAQSQRLTRNRRIGDRHTWMIDLDTADLTPSTTPDAVLEVSTFRVVVSRDLTVLFHGPIGAYDLVFRVIKTPVFRHRYMTLIDCGYDYCEGCGTEFCSGCKMLWKCLDESAYIAFSIMPPDKRPNDFATFARAEMPGNCLRDTFDIPSTWTYYDDEAIKYLNGAWEKQCDVDAWKEIMAN
jgi:hypothetical protein